MSFGFVEIDHLLGAAQDAQAGGEQYERLGFTVTPLSAITSLGVANRLVLFEPFSAGTANFFECMSITDAQNVSPGMARLLKGPEGIRSMVLSGPDALASHAALVREGYPFGDVLDLQRDWILPSGEVLQPAFRVTVPISAPLQFNFCEYRRLEPYLRDEWLRHENGALHMTSVFVLAPDPRDVARYFERVFGQRARMQDGICNVGPGIVQLRAGDQDALSALIPTRWLPARADTPQYAGFEVAVRSLPTVRALLVQRGVEFVDRDGALLVSPRDACGNVVRFVEHRRS